MVVIKNILSSTEITDDYVKLVNRIKHNQENLIDVTNESIGRGDNTMTINEHTYDVIDYDLAVQSKTARLFQTETGELLSVYIVLYTPITIPDVDVITPIEPQEDTHFNHGYRFQAYTDYDDKKTASKVHKKLVEKDSTKMEITEKVVGTSFREQHAFTDFAGDISNKDNVPVMHSQALLMPEPKNPYDPNAIMVIAKLEDGSPAHIGYVGRDSELYQLVEAPTPVKLTIMGYAEVGSYNNSFTITLEG